MSLYWIGPRGTKWLVFILIEIDAECTNDVFLDHAREGHTKCFS